VANIPHMLLIDTQTRTATIGGKKFAITIGRNGAIAANVKREGDGCTPRGAYGLGPIYFRPDRIALPGAWAETAVAITPDLGWCDDPAHPLYNQPVPLPFAASHEKMWRDDHAYDVVVVIQYNTDPVIPGRGSAIFLHINHGDNRPTAGCVAMAREDLLAVLQLLPEPAWVEIY
jgi:L,D-peptidoglycan transpeptidase YkuD (ErfK/YbiS/YcfS/YnhG family)